MPTHWNDWKVIKMYLFVHLFFLPPRGGQWVPSWTLCPPPSKLAVGFSCANKNNPGFFSEASQLFPGSGFAWSVPHFHAYHHRPPSSGGRLVFKADYLHIGTTHTCARLCVCHSNPQTNDISRVSWNLRPSVFHHSFFCPLVCRNCHWRNTFFPLTSF